MRESGARSLFILLQTHVCILVIIIISEVIVTFISRLYYVGNLAIFFTLTNEITWANRNKIKSEPLKVKSKSSQKLYLQVIISDAYLSCLSQGIRWKQV